MKTPDFPQHCKHVTLLGSERLMNLDVYLDIVLNEKCALIPLASTSADHFICLLSLVLINNKKTPGEKQLESFLRMGLVI